MMNIIAQQKEISNFEIKVLNSQEEGKVHQISGFPI